MINITNLAPLILLGSKTNLCAIVYFFCIQGLWTVWHNTLRGTELSLIMG